ncbi:hypothetical protein [Microlunatus parietis]|uniref:Uncharacterized protein n=1 Tax=Microlunatus parietis TaxID=682979 RepID=A0A7Y9IDE8_9ACTN|nr:hypothetical protein [Microlunatus parietis]NYE74780.1 hypothetical protein [Microlunatus parietis]
MAGGRRVVVWPAVLIALGVEAAGLTAVTLASYLTESDTGLLRWVLPAVVAFGFAMIKIGIDLNRPEIPPPHGARPVRRGRTVGVAVLVLVLLAGTGVVVGLGLRTGFQLLTATQDGVNRLDEPVAVNRSGLRFQVREVVVTRDFTRVRLAVTNRTDNTVDLPLYRNCLLTAATRRPRRAHCRCAAAGARPYRWERRSTA